MEVSTSIVEYSPTAAALADLARRMSKVVYDVSTPAGMAAAKKDRAEVRDLRIALEKKRVEIKEPALTRCREIDSEAKRITAALQKYEEAADGPIKAWEKKIDDELQAKVRAEQERVAAIDRRITELRGNQNLTPMSGSKLLSKHLSDLNALPLDASFGELLPQATVAKAEGLARLTGLLETALANEKESARLLAERAELDRQRAEQEAREKAERDRVAAETAEANRKLAAERAAFEAAQAVERARVAAENARIAAEQAAARKVIDDARRELEARQQVERDAQVKREREAEEARLRNFKPTTAEMVAVLCAHYDRDAETIDGWLREAFGVNEKRAAA